MKHSIYLMNVSVKASKDNFKSDWQPIIRECTSLVKKMAREKFLPRAQFEHSLLRKRKQRNYKSLDRYFELEVRSVRSEEHRWNLPNDDFRVKYFEALDLIMSSIRTRFDQPDFIAFSLI